MDDDNNQKIQNLNSQLQLNCAMKSHSNIDITIRVRPLLAFEDEPAWLLSQNQIKCMHSKAVKQKLNINTNLNKSVMHHSQQMSNTERKESQTHRFKAQAELENHVYNFQRVVGESVSSERIYKINGRKMVEQALKDGKDCTFVTYGQTCSGKTYTLLGVKEAPGFIPCIFRDIMHFNSHQSLNCSFSICYLQIYNEKLEDLLDSNKKTKEKAALKIINDSEWGTQVQNVTKIGVKSFEDCLQLLEVGQSNRKYGQKINHEKSSRSHTLMKIYIEKWDQKEMKCKRSAINVVDLAGSQRINKDHSESLQETGYINKSLFQFSNVIAKLSENNEQYIPYRDSKLTRLLQHSLTRDCNLSIIFCLSPAVANFGQSVSTLRLATKAKSVQIINTIPLKDETLQVQKLYKVIEQQKKQIKQLKQKITKYQKQVQKLERQTRETNQKNFKKQNINNFEKQNCQHSEKQKKMVNCNIIALLDHQNFMINFNSKVDEMTNNSAVQQIKQDFLERINQLYILYSKKIIAFALENQYDEKWLKIQQICYYHMHFDKSALIEYKIPLLKSIKNELRPEQKIFSQTIDKYITKLEKKRQNESCKKLEESPISQKSTFSLHNHNMIEKIGSMILSWGCKKEGRVFKNNSNQNQGQDKGKDSSKEVINCLQQFGQIADISCGAHHTLAVNTNGRVIGWGKNQNKQICPDLIMFVQLPKDIGFKTEVKAVAAGWAHSLLLTRQGSVFSYGFGEDGQLGHGNTKNQSQPKRIEGLMPICEVYAGHSHSGIIDQQGNYYSFGYNKDYRLMLCQSRQVTKPTKVNIRRVVKAALGITHTCLLDRNGKVFCGGVGTNGQLGIELNPTIIGYETLVVPQKNYEDSPIEKICPMVQLELSSHKNIMDVSCGECSTAVITAERELYTFGKCSFDRLGHNSKVGTKILSNVDRVQMGYRHGFAWNIQSKQVYAWGFNMYNQLGCFQAKDLKTPQLIQSLSSKQITKISTGFFHSAAIAK